MDTTSVGSEEAALGRARLSMLSAGQGPLVVLLHGAPTSAELWRDVLSLLAVADYRAVAPNLPGYGATRVPRHADHSLTACADLLAHWIETSGAGPAWIVGHDLGGAVAQILAVRRGDLVAHLTLINSVADRSFPAPRARLASIAARFGLHRAVAGLRLIPNGYMRRQLRRGFADPGRDHTVSLDRVVWDGKFSDRRGRAAFERHLAALSGRDLRAVADDLRRLPAPCQLVWGLDDPFQPWQVSGQRLAQLFREPSVTLLRDCGHFVPLECPRQLVNAMLGWHDASRRKVAR